MINILQTITSDVLQALYQPFGFAVLSAVLFMFVYLYAKEHGEGIQGVKTVCWKWVQAFKEEASFRRWFCLMFFVMMILFRTLLNRNMWANPLSEIMGGWTLHNSKGELTTESIENVLLFLPFTILLLWALKEKSTCRAMLWKAVKVTFLFSVSIEFCQLFFRLGTFQFSDIVYNTLGGFIGGVVYCIGWKIKNRV